MRLENLGEIGHRWHTCHVPASLRSRRSTPDKPTSDNSLCPSPLWNSISRMVASASRPISSRETNRRTRRLREPRTRYVPSAPMSFHANARTVRQHGRRERSYLHMHFGIDASSIVTACSEQSGNHERNARTFSLRRANACSDEIFLLSVQLTLV